MTDDLELEHLRLRREIEELQREHDELTAGGVVDIAAHQSHRTRLLEKIRELRKHMTRLQEHIRK